MPHEKADSIVVGAGIVGLAHAYHLARAGRKVTVLERDRRAVGASVRNFGMVWPVGQPLGEVRETSLRSRDHWRTLLREAGLWHRECGALHLAYAEDELQVMREFVDSAPHAARIVGPEEARRICPWVRSEGLVGAMRSETELAVDARVTVRELAAHLERAYGVEFRFGTPVRNVVSGVVETEHGFFEADEIFVCLGPDAYAMFGESVRELRRCRLQMMRLVPKEPALDLGTQEVAPQEPQGELLGQVGGGVGVPDRRHQVEVHGAAVAPQQPLHGLGAATVRRVVGLQHERPGGVDAAQVDGPVVVYHRAPRPPGPGSSACRSYPDEGPRGNFPDFRRNLVTRCPAMRTRLGAVPPDGPGLVIIPSRISRRSSRTMKSPQTQPARGLDGPSTPRATARRRGFLKALGLGAGALGLAGSGLSGSARAQSGVNDAAILNFALNLEYLEAEFYTFAATGGSIEALGIATNGAGTPGPITIKPNPLVPFQTDAVRQYAVEVAVEEQRHVVFLRSALANLGIQPVARPAVDLLNSFMGLGALIGVPNFDPFADEVSFLLGSYIFEDVGVTAYHGAAGLIKNKDVLSAAAGILAVEAYHSGLIRTILFARGQGAATQAISGVRKSLGGSVDYGVAQGPLGAGPNGNASIIVADDNAIAPSRSTRQVLNIVYGGVNAASGLFFPAGLNGAIR